jgi:hypothetical protein
MERLTAEDQLMLWPDQLWPQEIGCIGVLEGENLFDSTGSLKIDEVAEVIAARVHLVPRFRQLLYKPGPPARPAAVGGCPRVRRSRPPASSSATGTR